MQLAGLDPVIPRKIAGTVFENQPRKLLQRHAATRPQTGACGIGDVVLELITVAGTSRSSNNRRLIRTSPLSVGQGPHAESNNFLNIITSAVAWQWLPRQKGRVRSERCLRFARTRSAAFSRSSRNRFFGNAPQLNKETAWRGGPGHTLAGTIRQQPQTGGSPTTRPLLFEVYTRQPAIKDPIRRARRCGELRNGDVSAE